MDAPLALVRSCAAQMGALVSEESLRVAQSVAVGSVPITPGSAKAIRRQWEREARAGQSRVKARPASPEALASLGIAYIVEPDGGRAR